MISTKYIAHIGLTIKPVRNHNLSICQFVNLLICTFALSSCSGNGDGVSIEGRFLHMNQATFYVYSTDGTINGIDTVDVYGGRFEYDREIENEGTLVFVFPNYSQVPVFVEPGASISIEADAARLRELTVEGGNDNKVFTEWRKEVAEDTPEAVVKRAKAFIKTNPDSPISLWMIRSLFIMVGQPDYDGATALLKDILKANPDNIRAKRMLTDLSTVGTVKTGDMLKPFKAKDINGNVLTEKVLQSGDCAVITWASWDESSLSMLRTLARRKRGDGDKKPLSEAIAICLDADIRECRKTVKDCYAEDLTVICDGKMWESPLLKPLSLNSVPDNIVLKDGRIVRKSVPITEL